MKNNLVPVKHDESSAIYLFRVPEPQHLFCGTRVIVDTKKGKKYGTCAADIFNVADDDLDSVCKMYGTTAKDLRYVIGTVREELFLIYDQTKEKPDPEPEYIDTSVIVEDGLITAVYAASKRVNVEVIDLDNETDDSDEKAYSELMKDVESGRMRKVF